MKNLIHLSETRQTVTIPSSSSSSSPTTSSSIPSSSSSSTSSITSIIHEISSPTSSSSSSTTYLLTSNGHVISTSSSSSSSSEQVISWITPLATTHTDDPSHYFSLALIYPDGGGDDEKLAVLSHGGSIITIDPRDGSSTAVGRFENGIVTARWSPDGEILILVVPSNSSSDEGGTTAAGGMTMLSMTSSFETLNEIVISDSVLGPPAGISFRPDGGGHFALSYTTTCPRDDSKQQQRRRQLSIHDSSTLETIAVGRNEDGSGRLVSHLTTHSECLAWGGSAVNFLIGGVQQKQNTKKTKKSKYDKKATIVFFEPNGLRHGEFNCLSKDDYGGNDNVGGVVENLCWNVDGTLLAVTIQFSTDDDDDNDEEWYVVRLYHRRNYHWYGKYEHVYDKGIRPTFVNFDTENPLLLRVGLCSKEEDVVEWRTYEYCWDVTLHPNLVTAGVIDGRVLHLTPFEIAMVPPPMYAVSLDLCSGRRKRFIRSISSAGCCPPYRRQEGWRCDWVASTSGGELVLVGYDGDEMRSSGGGGGFIANYDAPRVLTHVDLGAEGGVDTDTLRQITVIDQVLSDDGVLLLTIGAISCGTSRANEHLITITLTIQPPTNDDDTTAKTTVSILHHTPLTAPIYRLTPTLLHLTDHSLIIHSSSDSTFTPHAQSPLLERSPLVSSVPNSPSLIISLSTSHHLYANDLLLHPSVSTFATTASSLLYATMGNKPELIVVPLSSLEDDVMTDVTDVARRSVSRPLERGSEIVCVVATDDDPRVVLQLPRGNLEGIYPKALTIPRVLDLVNGKGKKRFGEAFRLCRRRKVDLNLLVDGCSSGGGGEEFLNDDNVGVFVEEVGENVDYLNLFITCLVEDDVLVGTPWEEYYCARKQQQQPAASKQQQQLGKIDSILNALHSHFTRTPTSTTKYLLPILTTYAKRNPPDLAGALTHLKSHQTTTTTTTGLNYLFLICSANQNQIYEAALSLYDYDLARDICRKSHALDPKIYIPQLKRWTCELSEDMARYEVNVLLKRYDLALRSLVDAGLKGEWDGGEEGGCWMDVGMSLIERERLYKEGLALFRKGDDAAAAADTAKIMRERITMSLGDKLSKEGRYEEAMVTYLTEVSNDDDDSSTSSPTSQKLTEKARHAAKQALDYQTYLSLSSSIQPSDVVARDFVDLLSHATHIPRRDRCIQSARLLLDYCDDVDGAIDKLCEGEEWNEAMRIAADLTKRVVSGVNGGDSGDFVAVVPKRKEREDRIRDAAISSAHFMIDDLSQRMETFQSTMERYDIVVAMRRTAAAAEEDATVIDDAGSLYSTSSTISNVSRMSASSTGSASSTMSSSSIGGSVMSVASVRSSTFSLTGDNLDGNKHKSKYNVVGQRNKKKKKKKKQGRSNRIKPGSEEELNSLVHTLKSTVVDDEYRTSIDATLLFLLKRCRRRNKEEEDGGGWEVGRMLFEQYERLRVGVERIQLERRGREEEKRLERLKETNMMGGGGGEEEVKRLDCECVVDGLECKGLRDAFEKLFYYMP